MASNLPLKNLIRLNWLLVLTFTGVVSLYLIFLMEATISRKFLLTAMTAIGIGLVGFADTGILIALEKRFAVNSRRFKCYRYLLTYLGSLFIYFVLAPVFVLGDKVSIARGFAINFSLLVLSSVVVNSTVILMQNFVILQHDKARADLENSRLRMAHAEASNLLLKQQIHPHFLFNALNTLKALYRSDTQKGDSYLVHLANFLRASVAEHKSSLSSVSDELDLLIDYFEMQKIRFGEAVNCVIDIPETIRRDRLLPTFSLQPLVENAIKHNEVTTRNPLNIRVYCSSGYIVVANNYQPKINKPASTNQGLANLADRYQLISGDEILISEQQQTFSVSLKLLTDEYRDH